MAKLELKTRVSRGSRRDGGWLVESLENLEIRLLSEWNY